MFRAAHSRHLFGNYFPNQTAQLQWVCSTRPGQRSWGMIDYQGVVFTLKGNQRIITAILLSFFQFALPVLSMEDKRGEEEMPLNA